MEDGTILATGSSRIRLWTLGLAMLAIVITLLIVVVNPFETALVYLALLAGVIVIGLLTNTWGGLAASATCVFGMILFNQYAGIYLRENKIFNIGLELAALLLVGPLAGGLAREIERMQRQIDHWLAQVEALTIQDDTFATLKPEWARVRLDEEILRAARFQRPLSVALLQLEPKPEAIIANRIDRAERVAMLQAVIRVARTTAQPPNLIAHAGGNEVLAILPEYTAEQARTLTSTLQARLEREVYFPAGDTDQLLGKPISAWGSLRVGLASLNGQVESGEALLNQAKANLSYV